MGLRFSLLVKGWDWWFLLLEQKWDWCFLLLVGLQVAIASMAGGVVGLEVPVADGVVAVTVTIASRGEGSQC